MLSDPNQPDYPIVFASQGFLKMTGYPCRCCGGWWSWCCRVLCAFSACRPAGSFRFHAAAISPLLPLLPLPVARLPPCSEVVGRNCRFLQGPGTDPAAVAQLREALSAESPRPVTVTLLNYKKSGEPFWNSLHVAPLRDAGRVASGGCWLGAVGPGCALPRMLVLLEPCTLLLAPSPCPALLQMARCSSLWVCSWS